MKNLFISLLVFSWTSLFSQLNCQFSNIDDVAFAGVFSAQDFIEGKMTSASDFPLTFEVEWNGSSGYGSTDLWRYLDSEGSIVVIGTWNKKYTGVCFWGTCGKFKYDIKVNNKNTILVEAEKSETNNIPGWGVFRAWFVAKDGSAYIEKEEIYGEPLALIKRKYRTLMERKGNSK